MLPVLPLDTSSFKDIRRVSATPTIIKASKPENEKIEEEIVLVYSAPHEISKNELIFELKKHLATYMLPNIIEYKESLPLKASHHEEVDKSKVKDELKKIII